MKTIRSNRLKTALFVVCSAVIGSHAWATVVTWNMNPTGANADLSSNSQDFIVSGYTITGRGYDNNSGIGSPHDLHFKNAGSDEVGLGLTGTPNFELQVDNQGNPLQFIQLDLRSILSQGFTNGKIEVGSVQSGESFFLYGSNTLGNLGTKLNSIAYDSTKDDAFISVPSFGSNQFISVVAAAADVLPVAFQATIVPVPECPSLIPAASLVALLTVLDIRRRRRANATV
jgi:hypothetical protein